MADMFVLKEYYVKYLREVRGVKESTVKHYLDALNYISSSALVRTRARFACWRHIPNPLRMTSLMSSCALTL